MRLVTLRFAVMLSTAFSLSACSFYSRINHSATGFLADDGVVRVWQTRQRNGDISLRTMFNSFDGLTATQTDYRWDQQQLISISRSELNHNKPNSLLRFGPSGQVAFMQQQLADYRQPIDAESIALNQFEAQRLRFVTHNLLVGKVVLHQGRWISGGALENCHKQHIDLKLSESERQQLQQQAQGGSAYLAWIDAPQGQQTLLITHQDLCQQPPW